MNNPYFFTHTAYLYLFAQLSSVPECALAKCFFLHFHCCADNFGCLIIFFGCKTHFKAEGLVSVTRFFCMSFNRFQTCNKGPRWPTRPPPWQEPVLAAGSFEESTQRYLAARASLGDKDTHFGFLTATCSPPHTLGFPPDTHFGCAGIPIAKDTPKLQVIESPEGGGGGGYSPAAKWEPASPQPFLPTIG